MNWIIRGWCRQKECVGGTYFSKNLGGTGWDGPPNLRWGDGPCIGPPIFREVVLLDARESMNRVKRTCFSCEERVKYDI